MRYVLLGGGGFLGSHLCDILVRSGHAVRVFDAPGARYLEYSRRLGADVLTGDFQNPEDLHRALENCDQVFHLVSTTVPQTSNADPIFDVESNLIGTLRLLELVRKKSVKKVIFPSSGGTVYGIPKTTPIQETHPVDPISSYGITKLSIEKYLHLFWTLYGVNYCILRIANAYGRRQPVVETQGVIPAFLNKMLHGEEIEVWGDGSVVRDYVNARDIAKAFLKASVHEGEPKVFNIGSGNGHSLIDIIDIIKLLSKRSLKIKYMPSRSFDVPVNVLDISRAKKYLDWEPTVGLDEGITDMLNWMSDSSAS